MKKYKFNNVAIFGLTLLFLIFQACIDDRVLDYETEHDETVASYLELYPETYSEFLKLMDAAGVSGLLRARGNYTCFIPTNEAVLKYYESKGVTLEQMDEETIKEVVFSHVISLKELQLPFESNLFGTQGVGPSMWKNQYWETRVDSIGNIYINQTSQLLKGSMDISVHNGIIHTINQVLEASKMRLWNVLQQKKDRFSLFLQAMELTGLHYQLDTIYINKDYDRRYREGLIPEKMISNSTFQNENSYGEPGTGTLLTPDSWNIGFTVFMESDETYRNANITTIDQLRQYAEEHITPKISGTFDDPKNKYNSLNRFIAYHILDRTMGYTDFIPGLWTRYFTKGAVMTDYSETLSPYGLVEFQRDATGPVLNKLRSGEAVRILETQDNVAENGMCHELDRLLLYDENVENDVLNKRIRLDVTNLLPELYTNHIKGNATYEGKNGRIFPVGYFKNMTQLTEGTQIQYGGPMSGWYDLHWDEILIAGKYDVQLRLPSLPEATYEIRIGYTANNARGVLQIYFDNEPVGIPLDMRIPANNAKIGWVADGSDKDDPDGIQNDKMMHNRGYMKGPASITYGTQQSPLRGYSASLRRVITTVRLDRDREHWLRFKSVLETEKQEFMFDWLEIVPTAYRDTEEGTD
ncbi:MAG: fasciclin domain-containing protein [Dysgonamonadaceae bacterium]|jgi:uncharacterized surface protein with fasciclin (FAS1) repeats|nr:fasciclin domain-containing protein [Dysgonamonadaceae bacterium]